MVREASREGEEAGGLEGLLELLESEDLVELAEREEREGWESVRSDGSTARELITRAVIVIGLIVVTDLLQKILSNFPRIRTLTSHVAKEEEVNVKVQ